MPEPNLCWMTWSWFWLAAASPSPRAYIPPRVILRVRKRHYCLGVRNLCLGPRSFALRRRLGANTSLFLGTTGAKAAATSWVNKKVNAAEPHCHRGLRFRELPSWVADGLVRCLVSCSAHLRVQHHRRVRRDAQGAARSGGRQRCIARDGVRRPLAGRRLSRACGGACLQGCSVWSDPWRRRGFWRGSGCLSNRHPSIHNLWLIRGLKLPLLAERTPPGPAGDGPIPDAFHACNAG
mmetsp:Transcript_99197/g.175931  ORF Transcript_99197/g.175931 Transcript_99197/m.175931 type:complete len:236 (-) Transcript_99197:1309-2016(-)